MPFPHEHAARQHPPGGYERFRREADAGGEGVDFVWGVKGEAGEETTEIQSVRFDAEQFTAAAAKAWLKEHDMSAAGFEEATGQDKEMSRPRRLRPAPTRIALAKQGEPSDLQDGESDVPFRRWVHVASIGTQRVQGYDEPFTLTDDDARRIMALWQDDVDHGHRAIFDFNHGSMFGRTPEQQVRAGDVLQWRHDEGEALYALGEFTGQAAALIRSGGMDLSSPLVCSRRRNLDTGEWEDGPYVPSIALTPVPEQGGLQAIAASRAWMALAEHMHMDAQAMLRAIETRVEQAAKAGLFGPVDMHGVEQWQYDARVEHIEADWTAVVVHNAKSCDWYRATVEHDETSGECRLTDIIPVWRVFEPVEAVGQEQTMAKTQQTPAAPKVGDVLTEAQVVALAAVGDRTAEQIAQALALAAVLPADATPEAVKALAARPAAGQGDVATLTALRDEVRALSRQAEAEKGRADQMAAQLAEAKALENTRTVEDLLAEHGDRITPAMLDIWRPLCRQYVEGGKAAEFKALAESLPAQINLRPRGSATPAPDAAEGENYHAMILAKAGAMCDAAQQERSQGNLYRHYEAAERAVRATPAGEAAATKHFSTTPAQARLS